MTRLSKKLLTDLDELSTTLLAMGQTFSHLYKLSNDFNNSINCGKNRLMDEIYVTMNNSFMNLGNSNKESNLKIKQKERAFIRK